jgi:hypothetical protein
MDTLVNFDMSPIDKYCFINFPLEIHVSFSNIFKDSIVTIDFIIYLER